MTKTEYLRLLEMVGIWGKMRMGLLIETICATGLRASGVKYTTMEAVQAGCADIALKGKSRPFCCLGSSAGIHKSTPENKKLFPVRFFSPEVEKTFLTARSGQK